MRSNRRCGPLPTSTCSWRPTTWTGRLGFWRLHGATRPWAQRRSGWDRRFAKSVTMTFGDGIELDVHRMLADGAHGHRIPLAELFDSAPAHDTDFDIGGVTLRALRPEHRLLHSAYHLLLGSREPALMNLRDLAVYLNDERLHPQQVVAQVERWGGTDVLAMALDLVTDRLAVTPRLWLDWRSAYRLDPTEVELIERHRNEGSSLGRAKIDVARELDGVSDRVAYLSALLWPSRGHLESRGLSRRDMVEPLMDVFGRRLRRSR
ncbi:MAG: nucleotidyltransferase family protein [Microthrixaceae bacterium]